MRLDDCAKTEEHLKVIVMIWVFSIVILLARILGWVRGHIQRQ